MTRAKLTTEGWFGKAVAGTVLGFILAVLASALFAWFGPGGILAGAGKTQFNMWLVGPVWALVLSFVFMFRRTRDAWLYLGLTSVVLAAVYLAGRWLIVSVPA